MIAALQIFFGVGLGYAAVATMAARGSVGVITLLACFLSLALVLKGVTRCLCRLARLFRLLDE